MNVVHGTEDVAEYNAEIVPDIPTVPIMLH
jgi:hypothetical protein